jgi:hypothetical protein
VVGHRDGRVTVRHGGTGEQLAVASADDNLTHLHVFYTVCGRPRVVTYGWREVAVWAVGEGDALEPHRKLSNAGGHEAFSACLG